MLSLLSILFILPASLHSVSLLCYGQNILIYGGQMFLFLFTYVYVFMLLKFELLSVTIATLSAARGGLAMRAWFLFPLEQYFDIIQRLTAAEVTWGCGKNMWLALLKEELSK